MKSIFNLVVRAHLGGILKDEKMEDIEKRVGFWDQIAEYFTHE